jgi:hypothetical protein
VTKNTVLQTRTESAFLPAQKVKNFVALCSLRDYDIQNQFYAARGTRRSSSSFTVVRSELDCVELMIDRGSFVVADPFGCSSSVAMSRPDDGGGGSVRTK